MDCHEATPLTMTDRDASVESTKMDLHESQSDSRNDELKTTLYKNTAFRNGNSMKFSRQNTSRNGDSIADSYEFSRFYITLRHNLYSQNLHIIYRIDMQILPFAYNLWLE